MTGYYNPTTQAYAPLPQQTGVAYLPTAYPAPSYPSSQPQQPQADPIDQMAKVARLLDYLRGKEGAVSSPAQGLPSQQQVSQFGTPGMGNVAQFQPQTQETLDRQYQAMGLTQASGLSTQTNSQPWQQAWAQPSNNLEARQQAYIQQLTQLVNGLDAECNSYIPLVQQLNFWMQIAIQKDQEIEESNRAIAFLSPFVDVANIWAQDAEMHRELLYQIWNLYNDPGHLVYQAFQKWSEVDLTPFDLDTISESFLHLLEWQKRKDAIAGRTPQFSPTPQPFVPSMPIQQQVPYPPYPPVPSNTPGQSSPLLAAIELMRSGNPDTAKILQRARIGGQF